MTSSDDGPNEVWSELLLEATTVEEARAALEAGAEINSTDYEGCSILTTAVHQENGPLIRFLLDEGALLSPTISAGEIGAGSTPIAEVLKSVEGTEVEGAIRNLAKGLENATGHYPTSAEELFGFCWNPLHLAAERNDIGLVKDLLRVTDAVVAVNQFDHVSRTPLMCAVEAGQLESARLLIEAGADVNAHEEEKSGDTAIKRAADESSVEMVKLLLEAGADPTIKGWMGVSAVNKAERRSDGEGPEILRLIRQRSG